MLPRKSNNATFSRFLRNANNDSASTGRALLNALRNILKGIIDLQNCIIFPMKFSESITVVEEISNENNVKFDYCLTLHLKFKVFIQGKNI